MLSAQEHPKKKLFFFFGVDNLQSLSNISTAIGYMSFSFSSLCIDYNVADGSETIFREVPFCFFLLFSSCLLGSLDVLNCCFPYRKHQFLVYYGVFLNWVLVGFFR